jgi:hypothetical protein
VLAVALLVPAAVAGFIGYERGGAPSAAPADLPAADVLLSPTESRRLTPSWWLDQALTAPRAFHRAASFCRRHEDEPVPNCRNVLAADQVCSLLHSFGATP